LAKPHFLAKNILPSEQFELPMNMKIAIVKTFCDFGHKFFKKQPFFGHFLLRF